MASIGSNDLTQLTPGPLIPHRCPTSDERNPAVKSFRQRHCRRNKASTSHLRPGSAGPPDPARRLMAGHRERRTPHLVLDTWFFPLRQPA